MDFWQIVMTPFSWLLKMFCQVFDSYGLALLLFALVVKIILFPFSYKGKKSMIKMSMASAKLREIQKRCGNDRERYNQEVQKYYSENNINPMGGCGWTMIPMLILFPLYAIIRRPLKYMMNLSETTASAVASALGWSAKMGTEFVSGSGYNELYLGAMINSGNLETAKNAAIAAGATAGSMFVMNFNFLGLDLAQTPAWKFWEGGITWQSFGLFLLPVLSAVLSFLSSKVSNATNKMNKSMPEDEKTASTNRTMLIMMPVMSLWIGFSFPAGLCLYWIANSVLMMVQEVICGKMLRKDYEEAQRVMEEQARREKEAEKERRRQAAERKAAAIAASKDPKKRAEAKAKAKKEKELARAQAVDAAASREGMRTYARGRAYDPNRYPITPYVDPNEKNKKKDEPKEEVVEPLTEEEKALLIESGIALPDETPVETVEEAVEEAAETVEETGEEVAGDFEAPYEETEE